eukprot:1175575-Prorocentrum_minimum.AAC.1
MPYVRVEPNESRAERRRVAPDSSKSPSMAAAPAGSGRTRGGAGWHLIPAEVHPWRQHLRGAA